MGILAPSSSLLSEFSGDNKRIRLVENAIDLNAIRLDPLKLGELAARSKEEIFKELISLVNVLLVLADDCKTAAARSEELESKNEELEAKNREIETKNEKLETRAEKLETKTEELESQLAATKQQLEDARSRAEASTTGTVSWTQNLIRETITKELAAAKEQARASVNAASNLESTSSKHEPRNEANIGKTANRELTSTMDHLLVSTSKTTTGNRHSSVSDNVAWNNDSTTEPLATKELVRTKKQRPLSTSKGRSSTIKSKRSNENLADETVMTRGRSRTLTSVPVVKTPDVEEMPSRDIAAALSLMRHNELEDRNSNSTSSTAISAMSIDIPWNERSSSIGATTHSTTRSASAKPSRRRWTLRPSSRDSSHSVSPNLHHPMPWNSDRPGSRDSWSKASMTNTNTNTNSVIFYDVPRTSETVRETAIRMATSANKAICQQMRYESACLQGKAKWSYSTTLPDAAVFYSIFGPDGNDKKWKAKKLSLREFRTVLGDVEVTRFGNCFKVTGDEVKVKWDEKSLKWSMSGTYGL